MMSEIPAERQRRATARGPGGGVPGKGQPTPACPQRRRPGLPREDGGMQVRGRRISSHPRRVPLQAAGRSRPKDGTAPGPPALRPSSPPKKTNTPCKHLAAPLVPFAACQPPRGPGWAPRRCSPGSTSGRSAGCRASQTPCA